MKAEDQGRHVLANADAIGGPEGGAISVQNPAADLAWKLLAELRKETLESQRIRAQVIGFKITFVSTAVGLILARGEDVPNHLLVIPAFAAIFFDLLINSYSISIKRIGSYCRSQIEPILREASGWPHESPLWEEFMSRPEVKQRLSLIGNLGLTTLAAVPAAVALLDSFRALVSPLLLGALAILLIYDTRTFLTPRRISEDRLTR